MNCQTQHHSHFAFNSSYRGKQQMPSCYCIFCAGVAAVCSGTSSRGICNCGCCCKPIQVSFGLTEQDARDIRDDQDRIADVVASELEREIWMAEAAWLSLADFMRLLANRSSAITVFG